MSQPGARRRWLLPALAVLLICLAGLLAWWRGAPLWSRTWRVPEVATSSMAPPVREALDSARALVLARPDDPARWYDYGALLQAHALPEAAATCQLRTWRLMPKDPRPPYLLATMGPSLGWPVERTLGMYRASQKLDPRYPPLYARFGNTLADVGRHAEARVAFTRAVELDPSYPMAHRQLGLSLLELGDLPNAILHLEFAAELEEGDSLTWIGLARAYRRAGRSSEASAAAAKATGMIEVMSYRDSVYEDMYWRNRGPVRLMELADHHARAGNLPAAVESLEMALRGMPGSTRIHQRLADTYAALGQEERARVHREAARRANGDLAVGEAAPESP